jgi:hypothetical protein
VALQGVGDTFTAYLQEVDMKRLAAFGSGYNRTIFMVLFAPV